MENNGMHSLEDKVLIDNTYDQASLNSLWLKSKKAGNKKDRLFKIISAVDNGEQWSIYNGKIRKSQALPVSNMLSTIRDTRQGSMTLTGFVGEFVSTTEPMDLFVPALNDLFVDFWKRNGYDKAVEAATENMLTYGTGITMVSSKGHSLKLPTSDYIEIDDIELRNIDPSALYVEPGAKSEEEANYYFIKDSATYNYLRSIPMFTKTLEAKQKEIADNIKTLDSGVQKLNSDYEDNTGDTQSDFLTYIGRVKTSTGIRWDMVWMFAGVVIKTIEGITPNRNPLVFMREKTDKKSFWGQSVFKQNLAMQLSINEIDSAIVTHAKSQQDPIAIIDKSSGINVADFTKNRDVPGRTFAVNSTRSTPAQYLQKPDLPRDISNVSTMLIDRIEKVTGIGDIATGQGSGSLQTAGGISQILSRAGLKDIKVVNKIKYYLKNLYKTLVAHIRLKHGLVRYAAKDHVEGELQYKILDLNMIDWNSVYITVDISNHTNGAKESNRQIIAEMFQQSVQYSAAQPITEPQIMTADEYLQGLKELNLNKLIDQIMIRRKKEREIELTGKVTEIIQIYLQLVSEGVSPQEAIIMTAQEYSGDPGLLKAFTVADLAKQQAQAQAGDISGGNVGQTPTQ